MLSHIFAIMTSRHIIKIMSSGTIVTLDTTVILVIPFFFAFLTSLPVMCSVYAEEHTFPILF